MRIRASVCCIAAFGFWLSASSVRAQGGINFANNGTGWAEPWYGAGSSNSAALIISAQLCDGFAVIPAVSGLLAGTGFTAELWGGPEGAAEYNLQFLARTTFRTGTSAGLLSPRGLVPVPFAQPGQRVALQLRVYYNVFGLVTNWAQAANDYTIITGTSKLFTSEPLGDTPVTLRGMGSYCLTSDFIRLPVPVLSLNTGGILNLWGTPSPIKFWEPSWPYRSLIAGDTVTLKLEVPNPANSVTWSYNGVVLPGQTNQSLVLSNIQPAQSGVYSSRATVSIGSVVVTHTNSMRLDVTPRPFLEEAVRDVTGAFTASLRGVTNRSVAIESSTDLRNWLRGPEQWVGGSFRCTGHTVTNPPLFGPQLFYRAVILP